MKSLSAILAGLAVSCTLLGLSAQVQAQPSVIVPTSSVYSLPAPYSADYGYTRPWGYAYHRHHASTAAEGYMRGVAAMTRAQGEYNLMTSQANVFNEQARSMSLDNHKKGVETYFTARKINQESRAAERGPRPTKEDLVRLAKTAAPERLGADQFHPATGRISWPDALQGEEYAAYRAQVEQVFAYRAANGGIGAQERAFLAEATSAMRSLLRNQIQELAPMQYTSARRFLDGLTYEIQLPTT